MFAPVARRVRTRVSKVITRKRYFGPRTFVKVGVPERELNRIARQTLAAAFEQEFAGIMDSWRDGVFAAKLEDVIRSKARRAELLAGQGLDQVMTASQWHEALKGPLDIATVEANFGTAMRGAYADGIEQGARIGLRFSGVAGVEFGAERVQALAGKYIDTVGSARITQINHSTRKGVRQALRVALADEISPEAAANKIGRMVGLTDREVNSLRNFESRLLRDRIRRPGDDTHYIREMIANDVEKQRNRLMRDRGRRIAETEMQDAILAGEQDFYREMMETDPENFPPETMAKRWMTVQDALVCPFCAPLHLNVQPFEGGFPYKGGGIFRPPAHPKCRCYLEFSPDGSFTETEQPSVQEFAAPKAEPIEVEPIRRDPIAAPEPQKPKTGAKTSVEKWTDDAGNMLPERAALHGEIVDKFTAGAKKQKKLHLVGGGPASGKGTVIGGGHVKLPKKAVTVDADAIKGELPEFIEGSRIKDPKAAAFVHAESSALSEQIMQASANDGLGVILDGTGDGGVNKLHRRLERFRSQGYSIDADYMTIPTDEAVARAMARGRETGRFVPEEIIREIHAGVSRDFVDAMDLDLFDSVNLWDTNVPRGEAPRLVLTKVKGKPPKIHDERLWQEFVAKGVDSPEPNLRAKTSIEKWTDPATGKLLPQRAALHGRILDGFVEGAAKKKKLHLVAGGPASGKGTVIGAGKVKLPKNAVTIDADAIKAQIPEYREMTKVRDPNAAPYSHAESSMISEEIMAHSSNNGLATVIDGTGDGGVDKLTRRLERFRDQGYAVDADYMTLPTDEAVRRAAERALKPPDFRNVPEEITREIHAGVSRDFVEAVNRDLFDNVKLWDTNVPFGDPPRLVYTKTKGKPGKIHDQFLWDEFVAKGAE